MGGTCDGTESFFLHRSGWHFHRSISKQIPGTWLKRERKGRDVCHCFIVVLCSVPQKQEVPRSIQPVGYQAGWIIALQSAGTIYIIIKEIKCL